MRLIAACAPQLLALCSLALAVLPGPVIPLGADLAGPLNPPASIPAAGRQEPAPDDPILAAFVRDYAAQAEARYREVLRAAEGLERLVQAFVEAPDEAGLEACRAAWIQARQLYGTTEALRFGGGPIDDPKTGVEALINAWPVDEAYLDGHPEAPDQGLIGRPDLCPLIDRRVLELLNQRGGETNIAVGWHALEFLLFGVDRDAAGPGHRPASDFVPGKAPHAQRRGRYLQVISGLLVEHLTQLVVAWSPGLDNHRRRFEAGGPRAALRSALAGVLVLSGFELSGERLAVAYETQDQEQEHSCFSDTTLQDFEADQRGILEVWSGRRAEVQGVGLLALARELDPALAAAIERQLQACLEAIRAIPGPFDQAILGPDEAPGRQAVLALLLGFERQTQLFSALALELGFDIQVAPGG